MITETAAPVPARNLELKVRCDVAGLAAVRARLGAAGVGLAMVGQEDTYFAAARGRLQLRQIAPVDGEPSAELIAYARADERGPRWSAYHRVPVPIAGVAGLKAALGAALGVVAVVTKTREVGLHRRTRVHLDTVAGLGRFVELETVVGGGGGDGAGGELAETAAWLGLDPVGADVVAGSYADLATAGEGGGGRGSARTEGQGRKGSR